MRPETARLEALMRRVQTRERAAFSELYDATAPRLVGLCLKILKDRAEAEDAVQEAFVKVWTRADRYLPSDAGPMGWLTAIARNTAIDALRARRPGGGEVGTDEAEALPDAAPGPEAQAVLAAEGRAIERCLAQLADARAEAVRRAYVDGDSYLELAERFAVPVNTMRSWLRRSLLQLRACLGP